jgi:phosphohistidine phosphatase
MWLYLVQHGQAKTEAEDRERPLTDRGAADVRRVAEVAAAAGITTGRICHSGKTRARQTAEAWGHVLGAPVEFAEALAPRDDPSTWAKQVATDTGDLMLVGHMPHLGRLAGVLVADDPQRQWSPSSRAHWLACRRVRRAGRWHSRLNKRRLPSGRSVLDVPYRLGNGRAQIDAIQRLGVRRGRTPSRRSGVARLLTGNSRIGIRTRAKGMPMAAWCTRRWPMRELGTLPRDPNAGDS